MWNDLIAFARSSPGTLVVPVDPHIGETAIDATVAESAGCDVLKDFTAVAQWIIANDGGRRLVVGTFLYADGALFSRLAAAADVAVAAVCRARPGTALMGLCSPTEVFNVPESAQAEAKRRYATFGLHTPWERTVGAISRNRYLEQNVAEQVAGHLVQDSQVWSQGRHTRQVHSSLCAATSPVTPTSDNRS